MHRENLLRKYIPRASLHWVALITLHGYHRLFGFTLSLLKVSHSNWPGEKKIPFFPEPPHIIVLLKNSAQEVSFEWYHTDVEIISS